MGGEYNLQSAGAIRSINSYISDEKDHLELVFSFAIDRIHPTDTIRIKTSLPLMPTPALNHPHFLIFLSKFIHEIHFATIFFLVPQKPTDRQALMLILSMMSDFSAKTPQISPP